MRKLDEATKNEIAEIVQKNLTPIIEGLVSGRVNAVARDIVKKVVSEQVQDWNDLFARCNNVAYSADGKITAIWFYLQHPKGFCFRVDRPEGRYLKDDQWTFSAQLQCYFDYVYQGKIHTVTLVDARASDSERYISARVYEETDTVYRILIESLNVNGSVEVSRYEVIKAEASLRDIKTSEENVKRFDEHGDEKDAVIRFRSEQ